MIKKEKVFRDPLHRYITVTDDFIWELINTRAFQRLNNLHQLGGAYQIFHGATHTRFGHSLGAYAIAREICEQIAIKPHVNEHERQLLLTAALLHDIGHGPYSHAAESYLTLDHETMGAYIILGDNEIRSVLDKVGTDFAAEVIEVLQGTYKNPLLHHIISGQVDVDRMDYLLRDAYYAGVPYGDYDKDRIIRVMRVHGQCLAFAETGIHALENFMVSRYHMRKQVYYNTKGRAFEALLKASVRRFRQLWQEDALPDEHLYKVFFAFLSTQGKDDVAAFLAVDDHMFMAVQHLLMGASDPIIVEIASAIVNRLLPRVFEIDEQAYSELVPQIEAYRANGHPFGFYVDLERVGTPLLEIGIHEQLQLLGKDGLIHSAEKASPILQALQREAGETKYYIFFHKSLVKNAPMDPFEILKINQFYA